LNILHALPELILDDFKLSLVRGNAPADPDSRSF
jgi:hypothetical protein